MAKLGKETLIKVVETRMADIRQRKDAKTLVSFLPQRVEDGKVINFNGHVVGTWDGEDQVIVDLEIFDNQKVVTDAWLNKIFTPINEFFGPASEREEAEPEPKVKEEPATDEAHGSTIEEFRELLGKGKVKKAKRLLKEAKELLGKEQYKELKKELSDV